MKNKVDELCSRICKAVMENYDEIITGCESPYISLIIDDSFEIPQRVKDIIGDLPENTFVDELFGEVENVKQGYGLSLCLSTPYDDGNGSERLEEVRIWELEESYLERLANYCENHIGQKISD